jgi:hypothetical protein
VGRKTARDGGQTAKAIAGQIEVTEMALAKSGSAAAKAVAKHLTAARLAFIDVVNFVAGGMSKAPSVAAKASLNDVFSGSVPYLMLAGNLMAGWQMARGLLAAQEQLAAGGEDAAFMQAKIITAQFYAEHLLCKAPSMRGSIVEGAASVTALPIESY